MTFHYISVLFQRNMLIFDCFVDKKFNFLRYLFKGFISRFY